MPLMTRLTAPVAFALALAAFGPPASAEIRNGRLSAEGFQLGLQLGGNACVADGKARCDGVDPGLMLLAAPSYRFSPWVSLSLDLQVGLFGAPSGEGALWAVSAMPTLRGHLPLGPGALVVGAGLGYDSLTQDVTDTTTNGTVTWSTFLALKATLGYLLELSASWAVGLEAQAFWNPDTGDVCADLEGAELCEPMDGDVSERLTLGVYALWRF